MPKTISAIQFAKEESVLIESKISRTNFTFNIWGDSELEVVRVSIRNFYRIQQGGNCVYCQKPVPIRSARGSDVEHIAPKSIYPQFLFEPRNLCVACTDCNEAKREKEVFAKPKNNPKRYPTTGGAFKIVHPHFDDYSEHIQILAGGHYLPFTEKGYFTTGACDLNRRLREFGWPKEVIDSATASELANDIVESDDAVLRSNALKKLEQIVVLSLKGS